MVLGVGALPAACTWGSSGKTGIHTCTGYHWSQPDTLRGPDGAPLYVESPQFTESDNALWLIGSPTWAWARNGRPLLWPFGDSVTPNLFGVRVPLKDRGNGFGSAALIRMPPRVPAVSTPRGAVTGGTLHALFRTASSANTTSSELRTVWAGQWRSDDWSQLDVILESRRNVLWTNSRISRLAYAGASAYVFAPMGTKDSMAVLRLTEAGWESRAVPFISHIYSDIAGTPRDSTALLITYVVENDIFAGEFDVGTHRVTQAVRIASFPRGATIRTRAVAPDDLRRAVVWLQSGTQDLESRLLHVAESPSRGAEWKTGLPLRVRARSGNFDATSDRLGRVHVLFDKTDGSPSAPAHAFWDGAVWVETALPALHGRVVPSPAIRLWREDSILAVWAMAPSSTSMPVTVWSIGTACSALNSRAQN